MAKVIKTIKTMFHAMLDNVVKYEDDTLNKTIEKAIETTEEKKPTIFSTIWNELLAEAMDVKKGVNVSVTWERACHTYKSVTDDIRKRTTMVCRLGIDYNNQNVVISKRETGELPEAPQPIWHGYGIWVIHNYLIMHKKTSQLYLRLYEGTCKDHHANVQYFKNGEPVNLEDVKDSLTAKEFKAKSGDCFCVKIEDMVSIGKDNSNLPPIKDRDSVKTFEDIHEEVNA